MDRNNIKRYIMWCSALIIMGILFVQLDSCTKPPVMPPETKRPLHDSLTAEQLAILKTHVPGGDTLSLKDIQDSLARITPAKPQKTLILSGVRPEAPPDRSSLINAFRQRYPGESFQVNVKAWRQGKQLSDGEYQLKGRLSIRERFELLIVDSVTQSEHILDFGFTPNLDFNKFGLDTKYVNGVLDLETTPAGSIHGLVLRDNRGLLIASEARKFFPIRPLKALKEFQLIQDMSSLEEPEYVEECAEIYFPVVRLIPRVGDTILVKHGENVKVTVERNEYLIHMAKSRYIKELECETIEEIAPWELEYYIIRIDNPSLFKTLIPQKDEGVDDQYKKDDPDKSLKDDGPPNKRYQIDE